MNDSRRSRAAIAAVLATSLVTVFAALGGVGVATGAISAVQYQYGKKVTICHKGKTVTVAQQAVAAHVRKHDDTVGPCTNAAAKRKAEQAKQAKAKKAEHAKAESEQSGKERGNPGNGKGRGKGK